MKERASCSTGGGGGTQTPTELAPAAVSNVAGTSRGGKSFLQRARGKVIRWLRKSFGHQYQPQVSSEMNTGFVSSHYPEKNIREVSSKFIHIYYSSHIFLNFSLVV
jgi:hypothetical protein